MRKRNMQKIKTRAEILSSPYITQTEIARLLELSYRDAKQVYQLARQRDTEQLGERLSIYANKTRLKSVLFVTGLDYNMLAKQIRWEE